jgi:biopolymer transport protein TolR
MPTELTKIGERGIGLIIGQRFPNSLRLLICRIDVTALAAVLFVLVTALVVHPVADLPMDVVDSARTSHPIAMSGAIREDALFVTVTRDGVVWFEHGRMNSDGLTRALHQGLSQGAEPKVYIRADKRARYGAVKRALDSVRAAGIERIAFLVDGPRRSQEASVP